VHGTLPWCCSTVALLLSCPARVSGALNVQCVSQKPPLATFRAAMTFIVCDAGDRHNRRGGGGYSDDEGDSGHPRGGGRQQPDRDRGGRGQRGGTCLFPAAVMAMRANGDVGL
jgi:hypothetical protein